MIPALKPPTKRLPRPKRMTICIGMLATDGIVIAADAQETDQYYKRSQQKIFTFVGAVSLGNNPDPPSLACAFTGAGEAGYIDAFIANTILRIPTNSTQQEFKEFLSTEVRAFHEQHIFPLAASNNRPEIEILVGAHCQWQTCMFASYGSTLRRVFPHAAIGVGAHFAMSIIDDLGGIKDLRHTELLATYVVAVTKERIEGCGKYTAIVSLHNSVTIDSPGEPSRMVRPPQLITHVRGKQIHKWEESFETKWSSRQTKLLEELVEEELAGDAETDRGGAQ
jgi:hypothetical protein